MVQRELGDEPVVRPCQWGSNRYKGIGRLVGNRSKGRLEIGATEYLQGLQGQT